MKRPPSIRSRLSTSVVLIALVWSIAVTAAVWTVVRHEIAELQDSTLEESAQIIFGLLSHQLSHPAREDGQASTMPAPPHVEHLIWQVVDVRGRTILRSHDAPERPLLERRTPGFADAGDAWRVVTMEMPGADALVLHVAQDAEERREVGFEAAKYTAQFALGIGLACVLWLRWRLKRELLPVAQLSDAVRRFDPLDPGTALPPVTRAELEPMHHAITELSARLLQRIANERAFSAHAAHALRTPLAGLDAQLAVALRESPADLRPRLLRTRAAANRLQRVVTALLALFRSGAEPDIHAFLMRDLVAHLTFDGLSTTVGGIDCIRADADLIAAALMNLLDNSARHHASSAHIAVREENGIVIRVSDNGSGIPRPKREMLQQAIAAQAYSERTGLGLMLADLVARAHGGSLTICDEPTGCTIELRLPHGSAATPPV
ncbi:sensor histidine kinase [Azoarcus sp. L1K30]|uniref:sensor histidine kinase n=1 Tax=Azoarcus sp. L1K30 TaxID=2820277 RepID=UPI001B81F429|nr:sensor histidine kinase [Azoarcus sp. L1K30]MBR0568860.1 sensor histidine kinase [Azoarcus sp. L1K30]